MVKDPVHGEAWQKHYQEAIDFVLAGAVDLKNCTVTSGAHQYQFDKEYGCTCPDGRLRNRWCKHFTAVEMQLRVNARMKGEDMPKATPQDEWEAKTQAGEATEPALFSEEPEPDDIPDPEVPVKFKAATAAETGEVAVYGVQRTEGHQYTDYPSTLYIERQVGKTKIGWTFRGALDEEVWGRVSRMIRVLDEADKRYVPPQAPASQQAPAQQSASAPAAPPPPPAPAGPAAGKAVNHGPQPGSPYCHVHSTYFDLWSKGNRRWYAHKDSQGGFCNGPKKD
jgi:hypothetical protein